MAKKGEKSVKLEEDLKSLAARISLNDPERNRIDGIIEEVKSALTEGMQKSDWPVKKIVRGGSYERKTATRLKLDVDLTVMVENLGDDNDANTANTFDNVRYAFQEVLIKSPKLENVVESDFKIYETGLATKFKYKGISFDLVPTSYLSLEKSKQVMQGILKRLFEKKQEHRHNEGLLIEASNAFAQWREEKSRLFCTLAKMWQQNIVFMDRVSARSYLFECIAMKCAMETKEEDGPFYLTCFKKFLSMVSDFNKLQVAFKPNILEVVFSVNLGDLALVPSGFTGVYPPEFPWTNLLLHVDSCFIDLVEKAAKSTLASLDKETTTLNEIFKTRPSPQSIKEIPKYNDLSMAIVKNEEDLLLVQTIFRRIGVPKKQMKIMASLCAAKLALHTKSNAESEQIIANDIGEIFACTSGLSQSLDEINTRDILINLPLPCDTQRLVVIGFNEQTPENPGKLVGAAIEKNRNMRKERYDNTKVRNQYVNGTEPSQQPPVLSVPLVSTTNAPINVDVVINPTPSTDDPTAPLLGPSDQLQNVRQRYKWTKLPSRILGWLREVRPAFKLALGLTLLLLGIVTLVVFLTVNFKPKPHPPDNHCPASYKENMKEIVKSLHKVEKHEANGEPNELHMGVLLVLACGEDPKYLVHKGKNFGISHNRTVATQLINLSKHWKPAGSEIYPERFNLTILDFVAASGPDYDPKTDNSQDSAARMEKLAMNGKPKETKTLLKF